MITVVYDSMTGQGKRFAEKLGYPTFDIQHYIPRPLDHVFLISRTFGFGEIPVPTVQFIEKYRSFIIGCAVSGNRNWGKNYGMAGKKIEQLYQIPLIQIFEMIGLPAEVNHVKLWLQDYEQKHTTQQR
jgi:ribonucleoside-diphosphate reductase protein NrdI